MMNNKKYDLFAEQYLEVSIDKDGTWNVDLVIETLATLGNTEPLVPLRYTFANFNTVEEGDEFAEAFRFIYDKTIFQYELM